MAKGPNMYGDLPSLDPAVHAADALDAVLKSKEKLDHGDLLQDVRTEDENRSQIGESRVDVRKALMSEPVLRYTSEREQLRLLILSRDVTMLDANSLSQRRLYELSSMFAEIHVIILSLRGEGTRVTMRLGNNVWMYPTHSNYWWKTGFDAYRIGKEQLAFAQGFRADLIVAEDPFESGVAAYYLAEKYKRPFQIHLHEDLYDPAFKQVDHNNVYRLLMAGLSLARVDCVRTKTESLRDRVIAKYPDLEPYTEVLPMYHNLSAWRDFVPTLNLHTRYPQFNFIMLHVSHMTNRSHTSEVLGGLQNILRQYPSIGLIVVGSGPLRDAYEKQVLGMGLQNQILFEPMPNEVVSHMKSANVLIHLSEDIQEDEFILQAAAAKLPMIASQESIAGELFLDGISAFICSHNNPLCLSEKVNVFLNQNLLRAEFSSSAEQIVFERVKQDFGAYLRAYGESILRGVTFSA